ncbi:MAG: ABC transporter ATP-binding protein [Rhodospirillales bacterium]
MAISLVSQWLNIPEEVASAAEMMLNVRKLDAFYGRAQILFDVALKVRAGEVVVLVGRNGAGKSTTLKSVIGLVEHRGRVLFGGIDVSAWATDRIARAGLGYVPEERRIFAGLSVAENLSVGARPGATGEPGWDERRIVTLFPSLAELMERPAGRISGGEQQMLAIARSLMGNPRLVMLDEPSEGLAPLVVQRMAVAIAEMKAAGLAILLAEQNVHFARSVGDRAYVIEKGRIRADGPAAAVLADDAAARAYLAV